MAVHGSGKSLKKETDPRDPNDTSALQVCPSLSLSLHCTKDAHKPVVGVLSVIN